MHTLPPDKGRKRILRLWPVVDNGAAIDFVVYLHIAGQIHEQSP